MFVPRPIRLLPIGKKYGRLTVVALVEKVNKERTKSLFKCDCGVLCEKSNRDVLDKKTTSCGCRQREVAKVTSSKVTYNMIGKKYDQWKVISRIPSKNHNDAEYKPISYICLCECGVSREVYAQALRNGHSKGCGCSRSINKKHSLLKDK